MLDLNPQFPNNQNQKSNHNFNNHFNYRHRFNSGGNVQFRLETTEGEESGVCSPPLWQTNNNFSPPNSPVRFINPRALSPASRALAIARGKKEMKDMVENMPETSYELSLKDMVDQRTEFLDNETQSMEEGEERSILHGGQKESQRWKKNKKGSVKRQESNKTGRVIVKNTSMNNNNKGLLINMFFPFSIGSKKKSCITTSTSFRNNSNNVKSSPKPELLLDKSGGGDRNDWWWKKLTGSGDSQSLGITSSSRSGSSGSSGSSGRGSLRSNSGSKKKDCGYGCWSFFQSTKRKS